MRPPLRRGLVVATLACALAGCSPSSHTIGGWDPPALEKLEKTAEEACLERTGQVPPEHFTTDGCTMAPDGQWQTCCVEHDAVYWCGGSAEAREKADEKLQACVREKNGPAGLMYGVVRALGHPYVPAPWRWGYGWPWPRGYVEDKK